MKRNQIEAQINSISSTKGKFLIIFIFIFCWAIPLLGTENQAEAKSLVDFNITNASKPWAYWWWMGSAVDKKNLTANLELYQKAGIGGVHIVPIYGAKGWEDKYIDFLSPQWMDVLKYTVEEAARLGMGVDMSTGTGWPFGGPQVSVDDAATKAILKKFTLPAGKRLEDKLSEGKLLCLMGFSEAGEGIDLTDKVENQEILNWVAPAGNWTLYAVSQIGTKQQVKRAAPGGEGNVLNPFSISALDNYLAHFDDAFANYQGKMIRAFYNDSYEVYGANWTSEFFDEFKKRRNYDLRQQLTALFDEAKPDIVGRVKCDYRETIADLLLEGYTLPWVNWAHQKGAITRNEAHGSPGNLLDLYATADIPETEIFGPSYFKIPGLRTDPDFPGHRSKPDPLMIKFSSSAAHVAGRILVSSESCTWLGEHFKVALSQVKPEIDQLFISGVNHIFYHGITYSPLEEPWPGWLFYASTNFAPSNSFWYDFAALNNYVARCQAVLQSGQPANDILLYFPIYDWWNSEVGFLDFFSVHNLDQWLYPSRFYQAAKELREGGFAFDYISDRQLQKILFSHDSIISENISYQVVFVPECQFMPLVTFRNLINLAEQGATIIFHKKLPDDVPGFFDLQQRRIELQKLLCSIEFSRNLEADILTAQIGIGKFLVGENLEKMIAMVNINRESIVDEGIEFIRRRTGDGYYYFLTNLSEKDFDGWMKLGKTAQAALIIDPLAAISGIAETHHYTNDKIQIYLQLKSGQSCFLQTLFDQKIKGEKWQYLQPNGTPIEIRGKWKITFLQGGPNLPTNFESEELASWTELNDEETSRFAGTAKYEIEFEKPKMSADNWKLDLGKVCESARIKINGKNAGTLWSFPYQINIGKFLVAGKNKLEIDVTNLSANRIRDLDRKKVEWRKFHDINFVNINYKPFDAANWELMDSGLLGPVRLIPMKKLDF